MSSVLPDLRPLRTCAEPQAGVRSDRAAFPLTTRIASSKNTPVGRQCPACYAFLEFALLCENITHVPCCRAHISKYFISSCWILRSLISLFSLDVDVSLQ